MNAPPPTPIRTETRPRRHGMVDAARRCGVKYSSFYRAVAYLNGDTRRGRPASDRLEQAIRSMYPELIQTQNQPQETRPC